MKKDIGVVQITFIHDDGREEVVNVQPGASLMHAATGAGIDSIVAECGGAAMCATCHIYLEDDDASVPAMNEVEDEMLNSTASERRAGSRLSCQIKITPELDGLRVRLPATQV